MTRILLVAGARPNFMKIAPIVRECTKRASEIEYTIIHTGQHYDSGMSDVFFEELNIPKPEFHLHVGSGTHTEQTAQIMLKFAPICEQVSPDSVVVVGDVNSTVACSLVAKKMNLHVSHVEAGLRSGDKGMPEEINRIVTDAISDLHFVTEPSGVDNLRKEGHSEDSIHFVGHVMVDNLLYENQRLEQSPLESAASNIGEKLKKYGVVTLHRPSNVDDKAVLKGIVGALNSIAEKLPLIFPVHPRTKSNLDKFGISLASNIFPLNPLGYKEFLTLWRNAEIVLTDSGGLQEETTALGVDCITIRENTERPITIEQGTNLLAGIEPEKIRACFDRVMTKDRSSAQNLPDLWDGRASERIVDVLVSNLSG